MKTAVDHSAWAYFGWGLGLTLIGLALALWTLFGPLVFANALTAVWTCF